MKIPNKHNRLGISNASGLDFYAPFDEDLNDVIHGLIGTKSGSSFYISESSYNTMGKYLYGGLTSNSSTNSVSFPNTENMFQYGTGDFSISYWLQAPSWNSYNNNCVLSKKANDADTGFVNFRNASQTQMDMRVAGTNNLNTSTSVTNTKWVSWIFVRKSGVGYWYRNGVLDNSGACTGSANSTDILRIGYHGQWNTTGVFSIKALRIYNRALTSKQINDLSKEFDVKYYLTSSTSGFAFYPQTESKQISVSSQIGISGYTFKYQIISGELKYGLTLNQNTGIISGYDYTQISKLIDEFNIRVRISCTNSDEFIDKEIDINFICYKQSILQINSPQTFNFITQASETKAINVSTDNLQPTVNVTEGTLPEGVNFVPTSTGCNIVSTGSQNGASSSTVVTEWTTQYHQNPVNATFNIIIALNQISASNQTAKFYTELGTQTYQIKYTSQKPITAVYSLSGTLPSGVTFDTSTGTFSYDGTNTTAGTATVQVTIASSTGRSATATAEITLSIIEGSGIQNGLIFYAPLTDNLTTYTGGTISRNSGCSITTRDGKSGLHFGSQSYNYGYSFSVPNFTMNNGPFTISMWYIFANSEVPYSNMALYYIGKREVNKQIGVEITTNSKAPQIAWGPNPYTEIYNNNCVLNGNNHWHSFNMAYDGTILTYYQDGVKIGEYSLGSLNITDKNLWIGSRVSDSRCWLGLINNFAIHNYCFTQSDVDNYIAVTQ